MYSLLFLSALLPSLVSAFPPAAGFVRTEDHSNYNVLHPKRHPKDDPSDLAHLKAEKFGTLYYEGNQGRIYLRPNPYLF